MRTIIHSDVNVLMSRLSLESLVVEIRFYVLLGPRRAYRLSCDFRCLPLVERD